MSKEARWHRRRLHFYIALAAFLLVLTVLLHNQILQDVFSRSIKGAVYFISTEQKAVSITFDVVWEPGEAAKILDVLDRYQERATFFVTGEWLRKNGSLAREILLRGHEIGLHGYSNRRMPELEEKELVKEFDLMEEALREELNHITFLFRPPFGELDQQVYDYALTRGYTTVLWSINPHVWQEPGVDNIVARVMKKIHNGAIINLHTSSSQSAEALPIIIQSLKIKEYQLMPVSELLELAEKK